jgi:hypothetical protein
MAFYLIQVAYSSSAAKTLIANPQTREDAIKKPVRRSAASCSRSTSRSANTTSS